MFVHIAGGRRGEFNQRFGQPSLNATASVGSQFPFTDTAAVDPVTGERGAQLARLEARGTLPKIVAVNTAAEYWRGDASLVHADVEGTRDVAPHDETRVYLFAGCQHTPGAVPPPDADPNTGSRGRHTFNVVDYSPLMRAVLTNLDRWVSAGVEPPPSNVPRLDDGTGVQAETTRKQFERIPGAGSPTGSSGRDGSTSDPEVARGILHELPPKIGAPFVTFVPSVDDDGNDIPGIRAVELGAPLATFTGWNPRHPEQGVPGDLMSMIGSTLPFAVTRAAREASRRSRARRSRNATPRGRRTSPGRARRPSGSSPRGTCSPRTSTRWSSARDGSGTSSSALEPLVDLLAGRHPDALLAPDVVVDRLEVLDPVRHAVDVGMHGDRHHPRLLGALEVEPVELVAHAFEPGARFVMLDEHHRNVVELERVRHRHERAVPWS